MKRFLLVLILVLSLLGTSQAALDPETNTPYRLQIHLRFAEHRMFTPVFRALVERELRDSLQASLGKLAKVEVVTDLSLFKDVDSGGGLAKALESWHFLLGAKLHFVAITFASGQYEIEARQYDGFTGLPSPIVRRGQARDRQLVARTAAVLVDQDFGLTGTVLKVDKDSAQIALKGGALGVALTPWMRKGDVFSVAQVVQGGDKQSSAREKWILLQTTEEPKDGIVSCVVHHRWENPLALEAGVLGYRCLRIATTRSPLRIRIVANDRPGVPLNGRQVLFTEQNFQQAARERRSTNAEGVVRTEQVFNNVAFIKVFDGDVPIARAPVEIVDDRMVVVEVPVQAQAEQRGQLVLRRSRWERRMHDSLDVAATLVTELNTINKSGQPREALLSRAKSGIKSLQSYYGSLKDEFRTLREQANKIDKAHRPDLASGEQRLRELEQQIEQLEKYTGNVEQIVQTITDPKRKEWRGMLEQAMLLENSGDFDVALELYSQVLKQGADDPALKERVDNLRKAWQPRSEEHRAARQFLVETWAKLEKAAEMKQKFDQARKAFETCRQAGDSLTPRKLYKINTNLLTRLAKELEGLSGQDSEDVRKTLQIIETLSEQDFKQLNDDIQKTLSTGSK